MDIFGKKQVALQQARIGDLETQLRDAKNARNGLINVAEQWEARFFEQKRLYDELVFAQRKLIHEGIAAILNKE